MAGSAATSGRPYGISASAADKPNETSNSATHRKIQQQKTLLLVKRKWEQCRKALGESNFARRAGRLTDEAKAHARNGGASSSHQVTRLGLHFLDHAQNHLPIFLSRITALARLHT